MNVKFWVAAIITLVAYVFVFPVLAYFGAPFFIPLSNLIIFGIYLAILFGAIAATMPAVASIPAIFLILFFHAWAFTGIFPAFKQDIDVCSERVINEHIVMPPPYNMGHASNSFDYCREKLLPEYTSINAWMRGIAFNLSGGSRSH